MADIDQTRAAAVSCQWSKMHKLIPSEVIQVGGCEFRLPRTNKGIRNGAPPGLVSLCMLSSRAS